MEQQTRKARKRHSSHKQITKAQQIKASLVTLKRPFNLIICDAIVIYISTFVIEI